MSIKKGVLLALISIVQITVYGQEKTFTLNECLQYALQNSFTVENAELDRKIAKARVREIIGIGLPQINGELMLMKNQELQRFFTTFQPNGPGGDPGFIDESIKNINNIQSGDVVAAKNFFQLKSLGQATLSFSQLIFSGSYLVGLKTVNTYKEVSEFMLEQTKQETIQQVTKAFYTVLINNERLDLFETNLARVDTLLHTTKELYTNGFAESIDVDRIKVLHTNLKTEYSNLKLISNISLSALKLAMNYPIENEIHLTGNIRDIQIHDITQEEHVTFTSRPEYKAMVVNVELQSLNLKNKYASSLPVLSAFGTLGYNTQSQDIGGLFKTNSGIANEGGLGPDKWYQYSNFGINLTVPIFSGLQRSHQIQQEKLRLLQSKNQLRSLENNIQLEIQNTEVVFQNALNTLQAQSENMELANKIARITKIKFENGVGSNLEVITAESDLREAQLNYYTALYNAISSKIDRDKAYGLLTVPNK